MDKAVELRDSRARIVVRPEQGGVLARYDARIDDQWVPLIVPWQREAPHFGCQVLAPWSNRVSGGGFAFEGRFHTIEPNLPGEPFPIHGDAFQRGWEVESFSAHELRLVLEQGAIGPYRYRGELSYQLEDGALIVSLTIRNTAAFRLPYGCGFHPWFPRDDTTTLMAPADNVWLEDKQHLPTSCEPVAAYPYWDFSEPRVLPQGWINNAFVGWVGEAEIEQPDLGVKLRLSASEALDTFIAYSPSAASRFFCFEPVSHAVDAHRLGGLTPLDPERCLTASIRMRWQNCITR